MKGSTWGRTKTTGYANTYETFLSTGHLPVKLPDYNNRLRVLVATYVTFSPDGTELLVNMGGEQVRRQLKFGRKLHIGLCLLGHSALLGVLENGYSNFSVGNMVDFKLLSDSFRLNAWY